MLSKTIGKVKFMVIVSVDDVVKELLYWKKYLRNWRIAVLEKVDSETAGYVQGHTFADI